MKKNKEDFKAIVTEIGSLIESVVHYARQSESTPERFMQVCDDFLA
jgi:hypothetical protein